MANFYVFLKTSLVPFSGNISSAMAKSTCSVMVGNYKVLDFMLDPMCLVQDYHATQAQGGSAGQAVEQDTWNLHQIFLHPDHVLDEIILS